MNRRFLFPFAVAAAVSLSGCGTSEANGNSRHTLLNVSYDVSRSFYEQFNRDFIESYRRSHPDLTVNIQQSHGGASKQAQSVLNGLKADVVTLNQEPDIQALADGQLVAADWKNAFPDQASPYRSTMVLLVRAGNPKNILDWRDLGRDDVGVVMANPKTSGTARYGFLAAYYAALQAAGGDEAAAETEMRRLVARVQVMDAGARGASNSFVQRNIGDVLVTTENEAALTLRTFQQNGYQTVYPASGSISIDNPVAVVAPVAEAKGNSQIAQDYLRHLWSRDAQILAAEQHLRPADPEVFALYRSRFPEIELWQPTEQLGSWHNIHQRFFAAGGLLDRVSVPAR